MEHCKEGEDNMGEKLTAGQHKGAEQTRKKGGLELVLGE